MSEGDILDAIVGGGCWRRCLVLFSLSVALKDIGLFLIVWFHVGDRVYIQNSCCWICQHSG